MDIQSLMSLFTSFKQNNRSFFSFLLPFYFLICVQLQVEMSNGGFPMFPREIKKKNSRISFANILGMMFQIDF